MNIPIYRLEFGKQFMKAFEKGSADILLSGRPLSEDKYVALFETAFAKFSGAKYAVAVSNGTVAIELALKVLGVSGKTVLLPANTFFATSIAVTNAGGTIGLVDAEDESFSLDPVSLESEIRKRMGRKEKIGAVIVVHIGGIISRHISRIRSLCKTYRIPLVEDAAHAHGSALGALKAGTIGEMGCFSFFPTKVMTTGEGGIITTNNRNYADMLRSLKNFGRDAKNHNITVQPDGNNYKMTELTALLGVLEMDRVKKRVNRRNDLVRLYVRELKGTGYTPVLQQKGLCSHYKMIVKTSLDTAWLKKYCRERNVALTGEVYRIPIHMQPLYRKAFAKQKFPVSDRIAAGHICPPLYPELTDAEVRYVARVLREAESAYEK